MVMRLTRRPWVSRVLSCGVFLAQIGTQALADGGRMTLPQLASEKLEVILPENTEIDPSDAVQVFTGNLDACCADRSPMAGHIHVYGRKVTFDPAFDFVQGQSYTVRLRSGKAAAVLTEFTIQPVRGISAPAVVGVFPSGTEIPENTLRFYIHFSTPMQPHRSADFIKLIDANGTADTAAFMAFKQELWSEDRKRLTLLMDPGRIKRGVAQNVSLGPALLEGKSYKIVVDAGWPNAAGHQTAPRFEFPFSVSAPLRALPDIELWQIKRPRIASQDPIVITFDRPFDHELAQSGIMVLDARGQEIPGAITVEDHQRTWRFDPLAPWSSWTVQIAVDARLEDVAGNNFRELLDHSTETELGRMDHVIMTLELCSN